MQRRQILSSLQQHLRARPAQRFARQNTSSSAPETALEQTADAKKTDSSFTKGVAAGLALSVGYLMVDIFFNDRLGSKEQLERLENNNYKLKQDLHAKQAECRALEQKAYHLSAQLSGVTEASKALKDQVDDLHVRVTRGHKS